MAQKFFYVAIFAYLATCSSGFSQSENNADHSKKILLVGFQGDVKISTGGTNAWKPAQANQVLYPFDSLRTGTNSRAVLLWLDQSVLPIGAATEIEILPPQSQADDCGLHLARGIISFFHRDKPGRIRVVTHGAIAGVEGTEFILAVNDADQTTLSVIDGKVKLENGQGTLVLTNDEQAVVELNQSPTRTVGFIANNLLQWNFYYPAVLDLNDLPLATDEQKNLGDSLAAYRAGDLPEALEKFPSQLSGSSAEKIYHAALLLAVGNVEDAEAILSSVSDNSEQSQRLVAALRQLIAAVKRQPNPSPFQPKLATEFLANSYYEQSLAVREISLEHALDSAKRAATNSPQFSFALERAAELEFSFGRTKDATDFLDKSLALAPQNPEALTLKGFLAAAKSQMDKAISSFDQAIAIDSALGNAWLGRGLCKIRLGDSNGGRKDLLVAAALEPQRSELRSYLGKAYANAGDFPHATRELSLAEKLDPNDPTAWLYSALLNQKRNQINDAIRDLEKSQSLNDNRSVYRSQLLLDQDHAVRSANLATMYQDAGMPDVSVNEAARAVNDDYANYSAHLFIAGSYYNLRDPNDINLRYETPAANEYFLANLLAPASAGTLSPAVSEGEYSRLFEQNGFGVASDTEYLSRGAWKEAGAQFGTFGNFNYDFESVYRTDPGQRPNNNVEQRELSLALKEQVTPQDTAFGYVEQYEANGGDLAQYYDRSAASSTFQTKEAQEPIAAVGWHHEWSPGMHTLFLAARLDDTLSFTNFTEPSMFVLQPIIGGTPTTVAVEPITMDEFYTNKSEIYSAELQQIWELPSHTTIVGSRFQYGHFDTGISQDNPSFNVVSFFPPLGINSSQQDISSIFRRISAYGYHQWQVFDPLQLIGGVTYDRITFPENFRTAPVSTQETTRDQISPKAGFIWTPAKNTAVRFAYTRSISGASLDQSFQLEPSQVAGFIQSYRSVIPESIAGANSAARFNTYDLSLEQKFNTGTYVTLSGEILDSTVNRVDGAFNYIPTPGQFPTASSLHENLNYQEETLQLIVNQLIGDKWSLGAKYRLSRAVLHDDYPDVPGGIFYGSPPFGPFQPHQRTQGILSQLDVTAIYNLPIGLFAEAEALWFAQSNSGYTPAEPGDDFCQFNLYAGYRFFRRKGELSLGLLNVAGQDYHLNPLNIYNELPRSRTLAISLQLNF